MKGLWIAAAVLLALVMGYAAMTAADPLVRACEHGELASCVAAGRAAVGKDARRAQQLFDVACQADSAEGCAALGELYASGAPGIEGSVGEALRKACHLGSAKACTQLGNALRVGDLRHRIEVDAAGAAEAFGTACALNEAQGCLALAECYVSGLGVRADEATAVQAYSKACDLGVLSACLKVAKAMERDSPEAAARVRAALCDGGFSDACRVEPTP